MFMWMGDLDPVYTHTRAKNMLVENMGPMYTQGKSPEKPLDLPYSIQGPRKCSHASNINKNNKPHFRQQYNYTKTNISKAKQIARDGEN